MKLLSNNKKLSFHFLENGTIQNIDTEKIRVNLKPGNVYSQPGTQIYLRKISDSKIEFTPLLGSVNGNKYAATEDNFIVKGKWNSLKYTCLLQLSDVSSAWQWSIEVENASDESVKIDLIWKEEIGLKSINDGLVNEYYVAQYLERILWDDDTYGKVALCRQNMKEATGNPWLLLASENGAVSGLTDGMQFYGNIYRETAVPKALLSPSLPGNMAGESPIIALQEKPVTLKKNEKHVASFLAYLSENHSAASSEKDLLIVESLFGEFSEANFNADEELNTPKTNIFSNPVYFPSEDLSANDIEKYFGEDIRLKEEKDGKLLSFFCDKSNHVVLKSKEMMADRPHAHIMQANLSYVQTEETLSTTCFVTGIFNSHISQGNTNFNVFLSINTSQFNANLNSGQRIFVEIDGINYLLGMPSAFEMGLNHCRWIYRWKDTVLEVITKTKVSKPVIQLKFKVLKGENVRLIITHDFDKLNGWQISSKNRNEFIAHPAQDSMISEKFPDADFRIKTDDENAIKNSIDNKLSYTDDDLFVLETEKLSNFSMEFIGEVKEKYKSHKHKEDKKLSGNEFWKELSNDFSIHSGEKNLKVIGSILPWYGMNAITHYLTPYGLEQFSGAAWGTRDVSQGPIELLLSLEKYDAARQVLLTVFANQNTVGDWPQWWMFDSYKQVRAGDCHGDIYYWVILGLAAYIKVTGDLSILEEKAPYFNEKELFTVNEHIERLIQMIENSFIGNTSLVPFGGGDWNDSLQPKNEELAKRLISSWTVEMNYQAFTEYAEVYRMAGNTQKAVHLSAITEKIKSDFNQFLIVDGIVAGYGYVEDNGGISVLLHPTDTKTGIKYSLLPMDRGVLCGIFTKEQAENHQNIIKEHLKGPDGARLMDKPLKYKGGVQEIFQRAESSPFFGREIGLMYIHEHLRFTESQAVLGNADEFVKALRQAIPIHYNEIVTNSNVRQSNCYYSSSDVTFETRYEADEKYEDIINGKMRVDGGWRVYSSGPGVFIGLIIKKLFGFNTYNDYLVFDPVMTTEMDGTEVSFDYKGYQLNLIYKIKSGNYTPKKILINGKNINFELERNNYRTGGAKIYSKQFISSLKSGKNDVELTL